MRVKFNFKGIKSLISVFQSVAKCIFSPQTKNQISELARSQGKKAA
jgi:hypothetical protein